MVTLQHYLVLSAALFCIGAIGVVVRRNILIILMAVEVMFVAASVALLAFARWNLLPEGKAVALFIIAVVAAEMAVGLALILAACRSRGSVMVDDFKILKG